MPMPITALDGKNGFDPILGSCQKITNKKRSASKTLNALQ